MVMINKKLKKKKHRQVLLESPETVSIFLQFIDVNEIFQTANSTEISLYRKYEEKKNLDIPIN